MSGNKEGLSQNFQPWGEKQGVADSFNPMLRPASDIAYRYNKGVFVEKDDDSVIEEWGSDIIVKQGGEWDFGGDIVFSIPRGAGEDDSDSENHFIEYDKKDFDEYFANNELHDVSAESLGFRKWMENLLKAYNLGGLEPVLETGEVLFVETPEGKVFLNNYDLYFYKQNSGGFNSTESQNSVEVDTNAIIFNDETGRPDYVVHYVPLLLDDGSQIMKSLFIVDVDDPDSEDGVMTEGIVEGVRFFDLDMVNLFTGQPTLTDEVYDFGGDLANLYLYHSDIFNPGNDDYSYYYDDSDSILSSDQLNLEGSRTIEFEGMESLEVPNHYLTTYVTQDQQGNTLAEGIWIDDNLTKMNLMDLYTHDSENYGDMDGGGISDLTLGFGLAGIFAAAVFSVSIYELWNRRKGA